MAVGEARRGEAGRQGGGATGPVLLVYAHPDDEVFCAAGTTAALRERGVAVILVCATRGEAGQISDPALATPETLGVVREAELRAALAALDVADLRFLDYRDSGMDGTPENDDPRALVRQPEEVVAARLAALLREIRPATVITFGPDGIYGHPDHLYVHRVTVRAVHLARRGGEEARRRGVSRLLLASSAWRIAALYFSTTPRERIQERAARRQGPFKEMTAEQVARLGTPRAEISVALDVSAQLERKQAAFRAHRTQFGPNGPLSELPRDEVTLLLSREHFVRVPLPWHADATDRDPLAALTRDFGTAPL
jgi:LmbE family N-acetylglucosaminyl deacetylase